MDTAASRADRSLVTRLLLAVLAATAALLGVWAGFAPRSFYDSFPGFGRHWVSSDGPYNEHLVRDFGNLNLAVTVLTVAAAVVATATLVRVTAGVWLVYSVPHFVYHAAHLGHMETIDAVGNVVSLGLAVVVPIALLVLSALGRSGVAGAGDQLQEERRADQ